MPEGQQPKIRSCRRSARNRSGGTLHVNQMSLLSVWTDPPDSAAPIVHSSDEPVQSARPLIAQIKHTTMALLIKQEKTMEFSGGVLLQQIG